MPMWVLEQLGGRPIWEFTRDELSSILWEPWVLDTTGTPARLHGEAMLEHLGRQFDDELPTWIPPEPLESEDLWPGDLVSFSPGVLGRGVGRVVHVGACGWPRCSFGDECVTVVVVTPGGGVHQVNRRASTLTKAPYGGFNLQTGEPVTSTPGWSVLTARSVN